MLLPVFDRHLHLETPFRTFRDRFKAIAERYFNEFPAIAQEHLPKKSIMTPNIAVSIFVFMITDQQSGPK